MHSSLATRLKSMAEWRQSVDRSATALARWLAEHDLQGEAEVQVQRSLHERLGSEKLLLAFVAEFSRGKSELINAIFFGDTGRRVLPATPGRTTMCPVELRHDAGEPAQLSLLPIETRLRGLALSDLRGRDEPWTRIALDPADSAGLVRALAEVTRTRQASVDEARALGLWNDEQTADNPPQAADGTVEVPVWRHAIIQYPHPLLERGLVVVDTPGLNAIGAEPELTLGLLPAAHAAVFVLGADTGVTKSDLDVWRQHLGARALERYVVLNKIDTLVDPLVGADDVAGQIEHQRERTAETLGIDVARVFPLSARGALAARLNGDVGGLIASRLPELEAALSDGLLPRQHELLAQAACDTFAVQRQTALRRLGDRRRQNAEEMLELRGLRGKSGGKLRLMLQRIESEMSEFERCTSRLVGLRSVQAKLLRAATQPLAADGLRNLVATLHAPTALKLFSLAADFDKLCEQLRRALTSARDQGSEMQQMVRASFDQLNAEFGFSFTVTPAPDFENASGELDRVERSYGRFVGMTQSWRLAVPGAMEHFRRMLLSKLRVVFENAAGELDLWSKGVNGQVELQLRERRRAFRRRHEALQRIQQASGELETRIAELEANDQRLRELQQRLDQLVAAADATARALPQTPIRLDAA